MQITAVPADFTDFQNRANVVPPMGRGWEYVLERDLAGNAQQWGEEAAAKLTAKPVDVGRYDLVLHPSHLWLTIHESIAHPTELDRAMGYEANYAGTSFVAPPEKMLGKLKYGPEIMNIQGDRSAGRCLRHRWATTTKACSPRLPHHQERRRQRLPDHARAGDLAQVVVREAGTPDALARLLVRAGLGRRAVPAHAERVAAARHEGAVWEDLIAGDG